MLIQLSTLFHFKHVQKIFWLPVFCLLITHFATAQVVTFPALNPNDSATRKPMGCFYGYERTAMLYTASELSQFGSITKVGFYLNSVNNPSAGTPVVIRMKSTANNALSSNTYASAASGSSQVFSGIITSDMLTPGNWVTITLNTAFSYTSNNLVIFVETNFEEFGDENFDAKQFRHSEPSAIRCEFWEDDLSPPTDYGILSAMRPNVQLTFEANCTGTPTPGNTLSTATSVCANEPFTLSLQNTPTTPGLSYVWEYSFNGNTDWTIIPGATASTLTYNQTSSRYFRCKVTCNAGGGTGTSNKVQVTMNPFYECYCASYAADISDSKINSVSMANINTSSSPTTCESYTDYTAVPGNVTAGQELTIEIENGSCSANFYDSYIGVYIDYNLNGVYEVATELVYGYGPITSLNSIPDYTFILPTAATTSVTGMRVILEEGDSVPKPCGEYTFGETEDYLLNITGATSCTGTPVPGATLSTASSVCSNEQFTLSISNYQTNTGISYQWQSSTTGQPTDFSNISGATSATRIQTQAIVKWYRCKVTCDNSGLFAYSDVVKVSMNPFYACYCASYALSAEDTKIDTIKIGGLVAGSSPGSCESYTDNTALTVDLAKADPVTIHIDNGDCNSEPQLYPVSVAVYIDDTSKTYEASELVYSFSDTTQLHSIPDGVFTIPASAKIAKTGMRVVLWEGETVPPACGTYGYGETEDYAVNIVDQPPCDVNPTPGVASASAQSFCEAQVPATITLTLTGNSTGIGQTYQWQSSSNGVDYTDIAGQTSTTATVTVSATTWYRCKVTCSGNEAISEETKVEVKATPTGNTESDPIIVTTLPYITVGDNLSSGCWTSNYTNITQQPSPDVFYKLTLGDTSGTLQISTCATSAFNTYLHLVDEAGNHLNSNDNNGVLCTGNNASIQYYVGSVPVTLFIVVEGHASDQGVYTLEINFIADTATAITTIPSGVENGFSIYPNPSDGNVTVQINMGQDLTRTATLNLYNTIGQVVETEQVSVVQGKYSGTIHLNAALADGVYNLQLNDGQTVFSKPIVIQH